MEQKPSYLGTRSDFYTHVHDLPPQLGGKLCVPRDFALMSFLQPVAVSLWNGMPRINHLASAVCVILPGRPRYSAGFSPYKA